MPCGCCDSLLMPFTMCRDDVSHTLRPSQQDRPWEGPGKGSVSRWGLGFLGGGRRGAGGEGVGSHWQGVEFLPSNSPSWLPWTPRKTHPCLASGTILNCCAAPGSHGASLGPVFLLQTDGEQRRGALEQFLAFSVRLPRKTHTHPITIQCEFSGARGPPGPITRLLSVRIGPWTYCPRSACLSACVLRLLSAGGC